MMLVIIYSKHSFALYHFNPEVLYLGTLEQPTIISFDDLLMAIKLCSLHVLTISYPDYSKARVT